MKHIRSSFSSLFESAKFILTARENRVFFILYICLVLSLFFYSFTQVDLGLTINRNQFIFEIQRAFQYVGYFNRPLSTLLFLLLIISFFGFYLWFIRLVTEKKLQLKHIIGILFFITPLLAFPYNAFSYDVFNYIFDAKIITYYHDNPYLRKALDFPTDPMLGFMHWTHRVYPYGPVWLVLTVPLSFLGLQYFIPTLLLFKLLAAVAFAFTVLGIGKTVDKISPTHTLSAVTFFALNPLILIESLLSAHNDIVMMAFAIWATYFLVSKKHVVAYVLLFLSIGVKFATVFLLPIFLYVTWIQLRQKTLHWEKIFLTCCAFMLLAIVVAIIRPSFSSLSLSINSTFQPWYLLFVLPFTALLANRLYVTVPMIVISFAALLNYVPFLYLGNYDPPVPMILNSINACGLGLGLLFLVRSSFGRKRK